LSSHASGATFFARAKKERRSQKGAQPPSAAVVVRRERIPPLVKLILASAAVVGLFFAIRALAPLPWSYDEYFHLGLAREMRSGIRIASFRWTPFSILFDQFVDSTPLFHLLLMPIATLPLETAGRIGVLLGQIFLVGSFAWAVWILRVPRPWWFVLALPALGTLFVQRLEMLRPQVWLIGFSVLVLALLAERRWKALFVACALFGLTHTGGWIAIPLAVLWSLSGLTVRGEPDSRRVPWQPMVAAAGGWLLGQLVHPEVPANFRLFLISNFVVPFQSTAAGDAALRSQLGTEMSRPELSILAEQWPVFIAPAIVLVTLAFQPRLRSRATLTAGLAALAFLAAGSFAARRFLELGAPLSLLALALVIRERRDKGFSPWMPQWGRLTAAIAILLAGVWTVGSLRTYGYGVASPPLEMARWLGEHGKPGERVFTVQWADSSPLLYSAPQLQSLVALDPTAFYLKDPKLFQTYVEITAGRSSDPAQAIRQQFGARWATVPYNFYPQVASQLAKSPGVQLVYGDRDYAVMDLGPSPPRPGSG
ncbi:MAG TPA: hypothetical protein VLV54_02220, partial [Thermoanaerobaculia bacterium]|nr:hypothetical protein [Thermoanaerobaculia bacterium]